MVWCLTDRSELASVEAEMNAAGHAVRGTGFVSSSGDLNFRYKGCMIRCHMSHIWRKSHLERN
jgi:hypothetical protein